MTGRYKAYAEYKDSPIDWLDKIPAHWTTKKLKHLGEAIIGLTYSPNEVVDGSDSNATLVLRSSNVQGQKITLNDNVFVNKEIPEKLTTRLNDILICSRNGSRALIGKNALIDKDSVGMSFGAFMTIYRSKHNTYLSHVMNSKLFEYQSGSFLTSTINQLTTGNLNSFEIPFPSEKERECIANFLDHETAKIDTLITKQEKLIELLKEKRQAVISHTVTKGLNPDAPMKDSGVEWLGEVPEHWDVLPTKRFFRLVAEPSTKNHNKELLSVYAAIGVAPRKELEQKGNKASNTDGYWLVQKGDIIVNKLLAWMGAVGYSDYDGVTSPAYDILRKTKDINPKFYHYLFRQEFTQKEFKRWSRGIMEMRLRLYFEELGRIMMPMPPKEEQNAIVDEIEAMNSMFSKIEDKARFQIELLTERKTALISAAVTGKIDVRDWDAQGVEG